MPQSTQRLLPGALWYLPSAHAVHSVLLALGAWLPGLHGTGAVAPAKLKKPTGLTSHSAALLRLVAVEKRPPGHGSGADAPAAQYEPAVHSLHPVAPSSSW